MQIRKEVSIELMKAIALMQFNRQVVIVSIDNTVTNELGEEVEEYDESNDNDYLVLTDEEADEKCREYIIDSLWAFSPSFLADHTDLPAEVFKAIQSNSLCESNNDVIEQMISKCSNMDAFIDEAIWVDGRGHFMCSYDGNESEEVVSIAGQEPVVFYIYRMR